MVGGWVLSPGSHLLAGRLPRSYTGGHEPAERSANLLDGVTDLVERLLLAGSYWPWHH